MTRVGRCLRRCRRRPTDDLVRDPSQLFATIRLVLQEPAGSPTDRLRAAVRARLRSPTSSIRLHWNPIPGTVAESSRLSQGARRRRRCTRGSRHRPVGVHRERSLAEIERIHRQDPAMTRFDAHGNPADHEHGRGRHVRQHPLPGRHVDGLWKRGDQSAVGPHESPTGSSEHLAIPGRHLESEFDRPECAVERAAIRHRLIDRTQIDGTNRLAPDLRSRTSSSPCLRHRSQELRFRIGRPDGRFRPSSPARDDERTGEHHPGRCRCE